MASLLKGVKLLSPDGSPFPGSLEGKQQTKKKKKSVMRSALSHSVSVLSVCCTFFPTTTNCFFSANFFLLGKFILLYFSASWCPPCKAFSPMLVKWHNDYAVKNKAEIIFVSSDRDNASFAAYASHFPFPSIAYEERNIKQKFAQMFGITSIPSLIVLDPNGELITKNGREGVSTAPTEFPWRPKSLPELLEGPLLLNAGEREREREKSVCVCV